VAGGVRAVKFIDVLHRTRDRRKSALVRERVARYAVNGMWGDDRLARERLFGRGAYWRSGKRERRHG
jgi:hypothetical protein